MADFSDITKRLGVAYKKWKGGETEKDKVRKEFWAAIEEAATAEPEEKLVEIDPDDFPDGNGEDDLLGEYIAREYPAWDLDEYQQNGAGRIEAILILKPEFKAMTYVNPDDGMVYQRQFVNGSPVLDDERLQDEQPDLWIEITEIPNYEFIVALLPSEHDGADDVQTWIDERWDGPRTLKSLDSLPDETLALVQPYIHPGKPSVKLAAPRKAKPEELEGVVEG